MNRDFWVGVSVGVLGFCLLGLTSSQIGNNYTEQQAIFNEISNLYQIVQTRKFRVETSSPTLGSLGEHEVLILNSGPTKAIYTKLNNVLYTTKLSSN